VLYRHIYIITVFMRLSISFLTGDNIR